MKTRLILIAAIAIFISCNSKDDPGPNQKTTFDYTDFPVSVGNYWKYKVTDSISGNVDTLLVEVVRTVDSISSGGYFCLLTQGGEIVDSSLITVNSESFVYKSILGQEYIFPNLKLEFPFTLGDGWYGTGIDTISVVSKIDDVVIEGRTFSPVFTIMRRVQFVVISIDQSVMVVPGVGIVHQSIDGYIDPYFREKYFDLIDYNIN